MNGAENLMATGSQRAPKNRPDLVKAEYGEEKFLT